MGDIKTGICLLCGRAHDSLQSCQDYVLATDHSDPKEQQWVAPLTKTLHEMTNDPELAEVNERIDEHLKDLQTPQDGRSTTIQDGLWLALYRCTNYLPASLYDDLKAKIEEITDSPSPYANQDWIGRTHIRIFCVDVHPPIPIRKFDFIAHYDDEEGPTGEGSTPYMAILDLINNANPTERIKK